MFFCLFVKSNQHLKCHHFLCSDRPVQLIQRQTSTFLSTVAAVHLVLVRTSSCQAVKHLPQCRHLPPDLPIAAVQVEGATAF